MDCNSCLDKDDCIRAGACLNAPVRLPKLLIIGYARHGKDTVAELFRDRYGYKFVSSSLFLAERVVRPAMETELGITYETLGDCYEDRVNHRAFWYDKISAFNEEDPGRLAKAVLEEADIYVGMRSNREYLGTTELFDRVIWVDGSGRGLPPEDRSSMDIDYVPSEMYRIDNGGKLADTIMQVDRFMYHYKGEVK